MTAEVITKERGGSGTEGHVIHSQSHDETYAKAHDRKLRELARESIRLNRTFSGLRSLLFRSRLIALNAETASARVGATGVPFGVVVKELITLGANLQDEAKDLETLFQRIARDVGTWIRAHHRFAMYLRVIDAFNERKDTPDQTSRLAGRFILDSGLEPIRDRQAEARNNLPSLDRTWTLLLNSRTEAIRRLDSVAGAGRSLNRFLDRMNLIATQQSSFLATTARVEATHTDQTAFDLDAMATDIQTLARDFTALQKQATDAVYRLNTDARSVMSLVHDA
jgi:methyl-accepting chemotaxis protein